MAIYPASIPSFTTKADGEVVEKGHINDHQDETVAIATELGKDPAGSFTDVVARLNAIDATIISVSSTNTTLQVSTTNTIPYDNTAPQISEGAEWETASITPATTTNILMIEAFLQIDHSQATNPIVGLFQNSNVDALAVTTEYITTINYLKMLIIQYQAVAGTAGSTTFSVRYGATGGTTYVNRSGASGRFASTPSSTLRITERKP